MLHEVRMLGEIVVLSVLEDEHAFGLQQLFLQYKVGNGGQFFQRLGWVGKDEVELLVA
jgi:hypothetical protein